MAAPPHGDTPYSGKSVTSGSTTTYTTSVGVNLGIIVFSVGRFLATSSLWDGQGMTEGLGESKPLAFSRLSSSF